MLLVIWVFWVMPVRACEKEDIRFCARLMNWMPSFRNSRGTSSISWTWSAIVLVGKMELGG